jgi:hypothetical protein
LPWWEGERASQPREVGAKSAGDDAQPQGSVQSAVKIERVDPVRNGSRQGESEQGGPDHHLDGVRVGGRHGSKVEVLFELLEDELDLPAQAVQTNPLSSSTSVPRRNSSGAGPSIMS